jgi:hypothetical protein
MTSIAEQVEQVLRDAVDPRKGLAAAISDAVEVSGRSQTAGHVRQGRADGVPLIGAMPALPEPRGVTRTRSG